MVNANEQLKFSLSELIVHINGMADTFYKGRFKDALTKMEGVIIGIGQVMTASSKIHDFANYIIRLNDILNKTNDIIKSKDFIQLADIFEYEVNTVLKDMLDLIDHKQDAKN